MVEVLSIQAFYEEGRKGKLMGLKCEAGHVTVPPRHCCMVCNSENMSAVELLGTGRIISWTEVFSKSGEFPVETPYVLALVELEEGGHLLGILRSHAEDNLRDTKVRVLFEIVTKVEPLGSEKERPRIFFEPITRDRL